MVVSMMSIWSIYSRAGEVDGFKAHSIKNQEMLKGPMQDVFDRH